MRTKFIFLIVVYASIFLSCEKDENGPNGSENETPELSVNTSSFSFSVDNDEALLIITNTGSGTLSWDVISKPEWISISKLSGQLVGLQKSLFLYLLN